jgi:ParB-like chromosome segregation protein Spo0J
MKLKVHPLAAGLPRMSDSEFRELKDSIRKRGKPDHPVVLLDGQILDGAHRAECCDDLGLPTPTVDYDGDRSQPAIIDFVWRANGLRRHLTPNQRAIWGAKMVTTAGKGQSERNASNEAFTQTDAAKTAGVSRTAIQQAAKVLEQAEPEVSQAVTEGIATVADAAAIASKPKATQRKAVKRVKSGKARTLKEAAEPHERGGKQKNDPRMFERMKASINKLSRDIDDMNSAMPGEKFRRAMHGHCDGLLNALKDWQRSLR